MSGDFYLSQRIYFRQRTILLSSSSSSWRSAGRKLIAIKGLTRTSVTIASIDISTSFWFDCLTPLLRRKFFAITLQSDGFEHLFVFIEFKFFDIALLSLFFFDLIKAKRRLARDNWLAEAYEFFIECRKN